MTVCREDDSPSRVTSLKVAAFPEASLIILIGFGGFFRFAAAQAATGDAYWPKPTPRIASRHKQTTLGCSFGPPVNVEFEHRIRTKGLWKI